MNGMYSVQKHYREDDSIPWVPEFLLFCPTLAIQILCFSEDREEVAEYH